MMHSRRLVLGLLLPLGISACVMPAKPLAEVPIDVGRRVTTAQHTQKSILILPFEDQRGPAFVKYSPTNFIPLVHLFHDARDTYYPDQGMLRRHDTWTTPGYMLSGSVASAMPMILTRAIKEMGLTETVFPAEWSRYQHDYDYVLMGRIKRTHFRDDHAGIIDFLLGPFGVPTGSARYDFEYEITLLDGHDRARVILTRAYRFHDKRTLGAWYNRNWAIDMFLRGLNATLPNAVEDIAVALACDVPAPPPAPTPAPTPDAPVPAPGVSN
jgi:hypothetical protein